MAHRLPRYAAMAARWGVTVEAAEVAAVRDPQDFDALDRRARSPADDATTTPRPRPRTATATTTSHADAASARAVGIAALLTGGFMLAEVAGGLLSGSLALIADAGHMLTDFAALAMAWLAFRVARRPADARRTYGFDRLSVLAAFVNGLALFAVAAWIVVEAARPPRRTRARSTAASCSPWRPLGLVVNIARLLGALARRPRQPQPPRRAAARRRRPPRLGRRHRRGARHPPRPAGRPIDPILSVLVVAPHPALGLARGARQRPHPARSHARPASTPPRSPPTSRAAVPDVTAVRHLHAWSITEARPMVTLEAVVAPGADADAARRADQGPARRALRLRPRHRRDLRRADAERTRGCRRRGCASI